MPYKTKYFNVHILALLLVFYWKLVDENECHPFQGACALVVMLLQDAGSMEEGTLHASSSRTKVVLLGQ